MCMEVLLGVQNSLQATSLTCAVYTSPFCIFGFDEHDVVLDASIIALLGAYAI